MIECLVVFLGVILDQLSKIWAVQNYTSAAVEVIPGILSFTYVENTGAAFGLFSGNTLALTIVSCVLAVVLGAVLIKYRKSCNLFSRISLALMLAGAIGNLIDRIFAGYVVDFIRFDFVHFAVFNVADTFITVGTVLLLISILFFEKDGRYSLKKQQVQGKHAKTAGEDGSAGHEKEGPDVSGEIQK